MKIYLKNLLRIPIFVILFVLNTSFHGTLVSLCAPIKFVIPFSNWRKVWGRISYWISGGFIITNNFLLKAFYDIKWIIEGLDNLRTDGTYLVISNHLSLLDIPVAQGIFLKQIPFLLFFIKQQLLWIPFLGQALWALEYPTMKRYSRDTLKNRPELRGKDLETAKRSCEKLRGIPVTILNYAEGTRFTSEKHYRTKSPFINLLKPHAGGIHTVLNSLGDEITSILNITLVYPGHSSPKFSDLLFGRVTQIVVRIESLTLGQGMVPTLETIRGKGGSLAVRSWLNELWKDKDKFINKIHSETKIDTGKTHPTRQPFSTESVGVSNTTPFSAE